jgi:chromosome segregation ATPase
MTDNARYMALAHIAQYRAGNPRLGQSTSPVAERMTPAADRIIPDRSQSLVLEDTIVQLRAENSRLLLRLRSAEEEAKRATNLANLERAKAERAQGELHALEAKTADSMEKLAKYKNAVESLSLDAEQNRIDQLRMREELDATRAALAEAEQAAREAARQPPPASAPSQAASSHAKPADLAPASPKKTGAGEALVPRAEHEALQKRIQCEPRPLLRAACSAWRDASPARRCAVFPGTDAPHSPVRPALVSTGAPVLTSPVPLHRRYEAAEALLNARVAELSHQLADKQRDAASEQESRARIEPAVVLDEETLRLREQVATADAARDAAEKAQRSMAAELTTTRGAVSTLSRECQMLRQRQDALEGSGLADHGPEKGAHDGRRAGEDVEGSDYQGFVFPSGGARPAQPLPRFFAPRLRCA